MCQLSEAIMSWVGTNRLNATKYMKVKRMGITEILRMIWIFSANKIKSSESVSKQPTQLIIAADNWLNNLQGQLFCKFDANNWICAQVFL